MKLRLRFMWQNFVVMVSTILVTILLSLLFVTIYGGISEVPARLAARDADIIVLRDGAFLYSSGNFDQFDAKAVMMDLELGKKTFEHEQTDYRVQSEKTKGTDGASYTVIRLTPLLTSDRYSLVVLGFVVAIFFITFLIASLITQRRNSRDILEPIIHLKQETELLGEGELNTEVTEEGDGEIAALCRSVEQLRLKLKENVYYKEKYDDNRKFLISSISHDLKTPVTAIRGYIEGVLDGIANTEEKRKNYLEAAQNKTYLINAMIDDLLLYSKLDLNQIPFDLEKVEIGSYMAYSLEDNLMAFEREGKRLTLTNELEGQRYVLLDRERFRRVIQNVLDNARKHTDQGTGRVELILRENQSSVIIECKDNGEGIKKEDLGLVFDRFYRGDSARKIEGSSGLGLAIAKQIVEGLGGRIWAISSEGEGASFIISLKKVKN